MGGKRKRDGISRWHIHCSAVSRICEGYPDPHGHWVMTALLESLLATSLLYMFLYNAYRMQWLVRVHFIVIIVIIYCTLSYGSILTSL